MNNEVVKTESTEVSKFEGAVPFATQENVITDSKAAKAILNAPKLNFNTQAETWSPEEKGERKRLVLPPLQTTIRRCSRAWKLSKVPT